jgi:hypothetical protein
MKSLRYIAALLFVAALVLFSIAGFKLYKMHEQKTAMERSAEAMLSGQPMGGRAVERADKPSDRTTCLLSFSGGTVALGLAAYCLTRRGGDKPRP